MSSSATLFEARALQVRFAGAPLALEDVDLSIQAGESLAVVGESGSGKTTLALASLGLLPANARLERGEIFFEGERLLPSDAGATGAEVRLRSLRGRRIAFLPQDPAASFDPLFTIGAQVAEVLRAEGGTRATRAAEAIRWLSQAGLDDSQRIAASLPGEVSGGECQRAALAAALCLRPRLLFADEPTAALDGLATKRWVESLNALRAGRDLALIWISHDLRAVCEHSDRVAILYRGRVVETGATRDVWRQPRHPYTRLLLRSLPPAGERPSGARRLSVLAASSRLEDAPTGCGFAPRCPLADEHCRSLRPALRRTLDAGASACHYPERTAEL